MRPAGTLAALGEQRVSAESRAAFAEVEIPASAYLFSAEPDGGVPWTPTTVTKWFRATCVAVEIERVRLHDLRHFAATRLLAAGVPVRTVSGRLGHANAATTLTVYAHFLEASD